MTYKEFRTALAAALANIDEDAEDSEITIIDENDIEYEIGEVSDDAGENLVIFVETKPDED